MGGAVQRKLAERWRYQAEKRTSNSTQVPTHVCSQIWDATEADILGVPDGLGTKLERLSAAGNGQVPAVVRAA